MNLEIHRSGDKEFPSHIRMLLVGQPGVGKTTLAQSFPDTLWVNAGCGITTLAQFPNTPFINYSVEADLFALKQAIEFEALDFPVQTLVIDSVDELQRLLLVERLKKEKRSETKIDDWGWLNSRLHAICEGLSQLPVNIIYISHTKEVNVGDEVYIKPALAGQFCESIHEYVDMSLWMRSRTLLEDEIDNVQVMNSTETFQIHLSENSVPVVHRWVLASSQPEAEWVHDKTNSLPFSLFPAAALYDVISSRFESVNIPESSSQTYEFSTDVEVELEETVQDIVEESSYVNVSQETSGETCSECSKVVDAKTWVDLSNMRFGVTLCGDCFKKKG